MLLNGNDVELMADGTGYFPYGLLSGRRLWQSLTRALSLHGRSAAPRSLRAAQPPA
jgi:hypothetical protein